MEIQLKELKPDIPFELLESKITVENPQPLWVLYLLFSFVEMIESAPSFYNEKESIPQTYGTVFFFSQSLHNILDV